MSSSVKLKDYFILFQLAKKRLDSSSAYQDFQQHQGELLVRYLQAHNLIIEGKRVLDLGCGLGGYSIALQKHGAKIVSVDLTPLETFDEIQMFCGDALSLPLADNSMDWVICASLIEHVCSPAKLLWEIQRVLRIDGMAYLSFPPFYTLIGGHQFSPFHLLGERIAIKMKRRKDLYRNRHWLQERFTETTDSFAHAWGDWGLYPLTISKVEKLLREISFQVLERSTRWLPLDFSGIPYLREFLTWHVQFLLQKTSPIQEGKSGTHG